MSYWAKRLEQTQTAIADKTIADIQKQLKKYYKRTMEKTIADFEATYDKVLAAKEEGREPTPADLYKLDKYWQMQGQLKNEMQKLGDKEIELLSKAFEKEWKDIYNSISLPSETAFSTISTDNAKAMINTSWLADNKTFSDRVWGNTEKLVETLNENLIYCVQTGKDSAKLKELLQNRFQVSYNSADTLVRTETAHIQTQAAAQRYQDYGLKYYEFLGRDEHDIGCDCKKLDGKKFLYSEMKTGVNAPPMHPNCRCAIMPVIDNESEEKVMKRKDYELTKEEREQLEKAYKVQPEIKERIEKKRYLIEQGISSRNFEIKQAQAVIDGDRSAESYFKQYRLLKWDGRKKQMVIPKDIEKALKEHQVELAKENEKWQKELNKNEYDVWAKFIYCVDCGTPILKEGKNNAVKRCPECQAEHRKKQKAEAERKRRAKNKKK